MHECGCNRCTPAHGKVSGGAIAEQDGGVRLLRKRAAVVRDGRQELAERVRFVAGLPLVLRDQRLVRRGRAAAATAVDDAQVIVRMLPPLHASSNSHCLPSLTVWGNEGEPSDCDVI